MGLVFVTSKWADRLWTEHLEMSEAGRALVRKCIDKQGAGRYENRFPSLKVELAQDFGIGVPLTIEPSPQMWRFQRQESFSESGKILTGHTVHSNPGSIARDKVQAMLVGRDGLHTSKYLPEVQYSIQARARRESMKKAHSRIVLFALIVALYVAVGAPVAALPTPSKTQVEQSLLARQVELAKIETVVSQPEIAAALAHHGLSSDDVNQRLAQLSPEEIRGLSMQLDQLQAAGSGVPTYIWILIGILLGALIITAF